MTPDDYGLDNLLALDGEIIEQAGGFWVKFDAKQVEPSAEQLMVDFWDAVDTAIERLLRE